MDYEIISAIGKLIDGQAKWESFDITNQDITSLYENKYSDIRVTLKNIVTKKSGVLYLNDYENQFDAGQTLETFLVRLNGKKLDLKKGSTVIKRKGLLYREALSNKFKIVPVEKGRLPDNDFSRKHDYSDLFITKEGVDPVDMYRHTLVTVNGFVHPSDANSKGLWVASGYNTIKKRKKHCIGIISFEHLGQLRQIPIKKKMIDKLNERVDLYQECVIDIGVDCSNKTIMLVLGGYLHVFDYDVFSRISDTAIKVKIKNTPLMERIHASTDDLDIDDNLYDKRYGETNLVLNNIQSDEFILKYLTLPYSFIVLLDNNEVFKEITYPQQRGIPNHFITQEKPVLPMMTRLGKFEEYVAVRDMGGYDLMTADCQYRPPLYRQRPPLEKESYYNNARRPTNRYRKPYAYFFNLLTLI